ncbi:thiamine phosphate synthase [Flavobacterium sp.]|uniref:thiamine phosphate synthase n=1 Tax=Flavobacterium sp. TaxID=239 RepID=UPI003D6B33BE
MIVITNPTPVENEINIIHSLFSEGLTLLHIRKPDYPEIELKLFLSQIGLKFRNRLVLHQHHHLANEFKINRLHFSESDRGKRIPSTNRILNPFSHKKLILSTSTHSIEDFNTLDTVFEYAFLSPVFSSISKKDYTSKLDFSMEIKSRTNRKTKLVALGGIQFENIEQAIAFGFDNVALLGTVWNSNNPIENFKLCQQTVLSHSL